MLLTCFYVIIMLILSCYYVINMLWLYLVLSDLGFPHSLVGGHVIDMFLCYYYHVIVLACYYGSI